MPTKTFNTYAVTYTVKSVAVTEDSSVSKYRGQDDLNAVLDGLKKTALWTIGFEFTPARGKTPTSIRVNGFGYPSIDKHPGHVEGKGWKYNIDEGTGSVDRLIVYDTDATLGKPAIDDSAKKIKVDVSVSCKAKVLENTH
jgi:hypothetical protein